MPDWMAHALNRLVALLLTCMLFTGCVSTADQAYADRLAKDAADASVIQCPAGCKEQWEAAQRWATYSPDVKRVNAEPRRIRARLERATCEIDMQIDLDRDRITVHAASIPYGLLYTRTCGDRAAHHAIIAFSREIQTEIRTTLGK